jgi:hypothetical protein
VLGAWCVVRVLLLTPCGYCSQTVSAVHCWFCIGWLWIETSKVVTNLVFLSRGQAFEPAPIHWFFYFYFVKRKEKGRLWLKGKMVGRMQKGRWSEQKKREIGSILPGKTGRRLRNTREGILQGRMRGKGIPQGQLWKNVVILPVKNPESPKPGPCDPRSQSRSYP